MGCDGTAYGHGTRSHGILWLGLRVIHVCQYHESINTERKLLWPDKSDTPERHTTMDFALITTTGWPSFQYFNILCIGYSAAFSANLTWPAWPRHI